MQRWAEPMASRGKAPLVPQLAVVAATAAAALTASRLGASSETVAAAVALAVHSCGKWISEEAAISSLTGPACEQEADHLGRWFADDRVKECAAEPKHFDFGGLTDISTVVQSEDSSFAEEGSAKDDLKEEVLMLSDKKVPDETAPDQNVPDAQGEAARDLQAGARAANGWRTEPASRRPLVRPRAGCARPAGRRCLLPRARGRRSPRPA